MRYFKNLLLLVGVVCVVAGTGSAYAAQEIKGCKAVATGGITTTVSGFPPFPTATNTNYYDVYCGNSRAASKKDAAKEINQEIWSQVNTNSDRGVHIITKEVTTYEKAKSACKKEFDSRSQRLKSEKHYNYCY